MDNMTKLMTPKEKINLSEEAKVDKALHYITTGLHTFVGTHAGVDIVKEKNVSNLAQYIDEVLGEYNYYTARNNCYVTLREAIDKKYLYMRNGRPRQMNDEAILEWVYFHNPELEDGMDLEEVNNLKKEYLASDGLYPFFKVDVVDVNVYRRMTRKNNTPERYILRNLRGLSKKNNGHLQGEEDITRRHLYNTYASLLQLWNLGYTPVVFLKTSTEEAEASSLTTEQSENGSERTQPVSPDGQLKTGQQ